MSAPNLAPELPLGIPAASPPAIAYKSASKPVAGPSCTSVSQPVMRAVPVSRIAIDRRFGLNDDEVAMRHATRIASEAERIVAGVAQSNHPSVTAGEDGTYLAFSELPTILAARQVAASGADVKVTVIVSSAISGATLLSAIFDKPLGHSLFEQARFIQGSEREYGSRRAWMRAEGIDPQKWETRFSKVGKINQLDNVLLAAIDPHRITSARDAGEIVDIYAKRATRKIAESVLARAVAEGGERLNASRLFKSMIAAAAGSPAAPVIRAAEDGSAELIDAAGDVIASVSRHGERWSIEAWNAETMTPEIFALALRHVRQVAKTFSGASPQSNMNKGS